MATITRASTRPNTLRNKEGFLQMYKKKKWKSYMFRVTGQTYLHYFGSDLSKPKAQVFLSSIQSVNVSLSPPRKGKFVFEVTMQHGRGKTWVLSADTEELRDQWMETIFPGSTRTNGKTNDGIVSLYEPNSTLMLPSKNIPDDYDNEGYMKMYSDTSVNNELGIVHKTENNYEKEDSLFSCKVDYIIPSSTISNMLLIGKGHIGKVFKADYNHSDKSKSIEVAVKTLFASNEHTNKAILQEFELMASMVHPNIVKLYGIVTEDGYSGSPWIVLEYFPNGDLKTYLNSSPKKQLSTLVKYMIDISMGMHFITQRGLIHRDLAARNVFVGDGELCKIADFGLLRELPCSLNVQGHSELPIPIRWMSPEAINNEEFSIASDVWSYGILQWELFNPRTLPYSDINSQEVVKYVTNGGRLLIPDDCPPFIAEMMKNCWSGDPNSRPSFSNISSVLSTKINFLT